MTQKKNWTAKAKLDIALLAVKGDLTINEICQRYQVAPSLVHKWKKHLLESGTDLFEKESKKKKKQSTQDTKQAQEALYAKIGQLTVERDFLKKAWNKLHGDNDES